MSVSIHVVLERTALTIASTPKPIWIFIKTTEARILTVSFA